MTGQMGIRNVLAAASCLTRGACPENGSHSLVAVKQDQSSVDPSEVDQKPGSTNEVIHDHHGDTTCIILYLLVVFFKTHSQLLKPEATLEISAVNCTPIR